MPLLVCCVSTKDLYSPNISSDLPMQETWIRSLSWEDPLEKEMTTHSSIAWEIPWTEEPGGLQSMGGAKSRPPLSD